MEIDDRAILETFLAESEENLLALSELLIVLEQRPDDRGILDALLRLLHTLKGGALIVGADDLADFVHGLESCLEPVRDGLVVVTGSSVSLMLAASDLLRARLDDVAAGRRERRSDPREQRLLDELARTTSSHAGAVLPAGDGIAADPVVARRLAEAEIRGQTLRISLASLDRLLNLIGEIAVARGRLTEALGGRQGSCAEALEVHREADRLFVDLQETVTKARLVRVGPTLHQLRRVVRDAAAALGKQVRLAIEGEEVELDTKVLEQIRDPLMHMIRNAVDHGIEAPDLRALRGKSPAGTIRVRAAHEAGSVVIQVADDGCGLDDRAILARATERGLAEPSRPLPREALHRLILQPGFTTRDAVTDLSGRGVGLDVVWRRVEALRGAVEIESSEGSGTTMTIRLPLTVAIIEGFGVDVAGETFILAMDGVVECRQLPEEEALRERPSGCLLVRDESLPYVRLGDLLGIPPGDRRARGSEARRREHVLVLSQGGRRLGIVVDGLHGQRQTVVKPNGRLLREVGGVLGSAILGDGRVALILDVPALLAAHATRAPLAAA